MAVDILGAGALSKRAQMMLELVVDIKNNRKRESSGASGGGGGAALAPTVAKWLKSCGVREMAVGGITWDKVLQPDKRGIWWRPEAGDALAPQRGSGGKLAAAAADAAGGGADMDGGLTAPELLRLAAAQRMNTDARCAALVCNMCNMRLGGPEATVACCLNLPSAVVARVHVDVCILPPPDAPCRLTLLAIVHLPSLQARRVLHDHGQQRLRGCL